jgi:hypothetical protein
MTSWTSSSASRALLVAAAVAAAACGHGPRARVERPLRVMVLPPHDLTVGGAPLAAVRDEVELALARLGLELVTGAAVDELLARVRLRHTGGIDREAARAARETLGVDAVLVTTVSQWREGAPPALQLGMRLVSVEEDPRILWIDGAARHGLDEVGLLGLGEVRDVRKLLRPALRTLRDSLARSLARPGRRAAPCEPERRFAPQAAYRYPGLDLRSAKRVAVLPFQNRTKRRGAGDVVALEVTRGLASIPAVRLVEPGVVRRLMLQFRVVMPEGVSLEVGDMLMSTEEVDLVVSGVVYQYQESGPALGFTTVIFDTRSREVVWRSDSRHGGRDGVVFFDAGTIRAPGALACRMVGSVVGELARPPPRRRTFGFVGTDAILAER